MHSSPTAVFNRLFMPALHTLCTPWLFVTDDVEKIGSYLQWAHSYRPQPCLPCQPGLVNIMNAAAAAKLRREAGAKLSAASAARLDPEAAVAAIAVHIPQLQHSCLENSTITSGEAMLKLDAAQPANGSLLQRRLLSQAVRQPTTESQVDAQKFITLCLLLDRRFSSFALQRLDSTYMSCCECR
jgi:hypothetical protein